MRKLDTLLMIVALSSTWILGGCGKKNLAKVPAPVPEEEVASVPSPPPPPSSPAPPAPVSTEADWFRTASIQELQSRLSDIYFEYDQSELRADSRAALTRNAEWLKRDYNTASIEIEGHCDERGTNEYNLALGERRADTPMGYLVSLGVSPERLRTVSYGKERPQCMEPHEDCRFKNRRAHFRIVSK